jgi:uncharacterized protein YndB with AHSA1/START domain
MPVNKDFKRLVRGRMKKTGESYTTARANLLKSRSSRTTRPRVPSRATAAVAPATAAAPANRAAQGRTAAAPTPDYARLAGMSDAAVKAKTGCTWDRWVLALDYHKAYDWPHRKIVEYVHQKYKMPGWWSQMVTVGYERIKGLRDVGQRRGGSYEASKSRTFNAPAAAVFDAFADESVRSRWLPGVSLTVRKATSPKSVRITWDDGSSVQVWLTAKGAGKCSAAVQHTKLPDRAAVERTKQYWAERLAALGEVLKA